MRRFFASSTFFLLAITLLVAAADVLLYGKIPGWSLGLFILLLAASIMTRTFHLTMQVIAINMLIVGIAISMFLSPKFLSVFLSIILIVSLAVFSRNAFSTRVITLLRHAWGIAGGFFYRWLLDRWLMSRWMRRHQPRRVGVVRYVVGWLIPLLFGSIFIILFANANPVLDLWLGKISDFLSRILNQLPDYIEPLRVLFWIFIALCVWTLLRAKRIKPIKWMPKVSLPPVGNTPTTLLTRCLLVFNVIFAVQSILDGTFLWAHAELPRHMTYASYAHRGAYLLVVTALLAAGFIAMTFRQIHTSPKLLRWLLWIWIVQNVFLMVSTLLRLDLYVSVYSLTYWRISAAVWMLLIALGFVWFMIALAMGRNLAWLVKMNMLTCFGILYLCCFPSFAGLIADFNVRHCREVAGTTDQTILSASNEPQPAPIDLTYLINLGPDASPAIRALIPHLRDDSQIQPMLRCLESNHEEVARILSTWQSWTLRRQWLLEDAERQMSTAR